MLDILKEIIKAKHPDFNRHLGSPAVFQRICDSRLAPSLPFWNQKGAPLFGITILIPWLFMEAVLSPLGLQGSRNVEDTEGWDLLLHLP